MALIRKEVRAACAAAKAHHGKAGYRVPFIARWPGTIPAGAISNGISMNIDLLPTLQAITGAVLPPGLDWMVKTSKDYCTEFKFAT